MSFKTIFGIVVLCIALVSALPPYKVVLPPDSSGDSSSSSDDYGEMSDDKRLALQTNEVKPGSGDAATPKRKNQDDLDSGSLDYQEDMPATRAAGFINMEKAPQSTWEHILEMLYGL